MKRLIASALALSVIAGPAFATTTAAAPAKVTKQVKKSKVAASAKVAPAKPAKKK
jgi:hypothetical protein